MTEQKEAATLDTLNTAAETLHELWCGERDSWAVRHDDNHWTSEPGYWVVTLTGVIEGGDHLNEWTALDWEFYDENLAVAMSAAVAFASVLDAWRLCSCCDGRGFVKASDGPVDTCPDCNGRMVAPILNGASNGSSGGSE